MDGRGLPRVVYFSNISENTHRFVQKLDLDKPALRIPVRAGYPSLEVDEPYVLFTPTYGSGVDRKAVPKQVIHFLNNPVNRDYILGVVVGGNTNFGADFCLAGDIIAKKCKTFVLYKFELMGTDHDVFEVNRKLSFFKKGC